jgi:hypothetical protein
VVSSARVVRYYLCPGRRAFRPVAAHSQRCYGCLSAGGWIVDTCDLRASSILLWISSICSRSAFERHFGILRTIIRSVFGPAGRNCPAGKTWASSPCALSDSTKAWAASCDPSLGPASYSTATPSCPKVIELGGGGALSVGDGLNHLPHRPAFCRQAVGNCRGKALQCRVLAAVIVVHEEDAQGGRVVISLHFLLQHECPRLRKSAGPLA